MLVSVRGEADTVARAYRGLARRSPFLAALLALFLLSLAGIPPTAGFIAKVVVFSAAVQAGYWPLVLVAVLASVAAAFFYLRVIVLMYMQEPEPRWRRPLTGAVLGRLALAAPAASRSPSGILPGLLLGLLRARVVRSGSDAAGVARVPRRPVASGR